MPINWGGNEKFGVSILERVTNWLSQTGSRVYPALLEDALDLFRGDQRAGCIMDSHVSCGCLEMIEPGPDGILTMFSAGYDRPNLFEFFIADNLFYFSQSIFTCDGNDPAHAPDALKCVDRMGNDWSAGDRRKQFVETHATTVTGGNDDGG
jgi:hypothetical protein